jgi:carbamoylphosphate synthase large subunit
MNERIRQLAEQALQLVADEHTNGDESRLNTDSYHVKDLIQEKFAELIVRECLTFVEPMPGSGDIDDLALEAAREGIKEHFGVEE